MSVSNRYEEQYASCTLPWNGTICPHGVDHAHKPYTPKDQVCSVCLEYAMQAS